MKNKPLSQTKRVGLLNLNVFFFVFVFISISSCKVTAPTSYFQSLQKDTTIKGFVTNNYESKIIKGDRLSIAVSSLSPIEDAIFNNATTTSTGSTDATGYTVQSDGTILIHRIGNLIAEGLTRKELAKKIEIGLLPYTKEPIVKVAYLNHKITILGEVKGAQVLKMPEEQISLIDALVLSGDVSEKAKLNDITIIREEGEEKKVKHINLEDHSIFSSPWYYLRPNDIIMVGVDNTKLVKDEKKQKLQNSISIITTVVSLALVILSRFIK